jgi:hypothetical protein
VELISELRALFERLATRLDLYTAIADVTLEAMVPKYISRLDDLKGVKALSDPVNELLLISYKYLVDKPVLLQGMTNPAGKQVGHVGVQGPAGERGPACEQGLAGEQGPTSEQGRKGEQRKKGEQGEQVEQGDKGNMGIPGLPGLARALGVG